MKKQELKQKINEKLEEGKPKRAASLLITYEGLFNKQESERLFKKINKVETQQDYKFYKHIIKNYNLEARENNYKKLVEDYNYFKDLADNLREDADSLESGKLEDLADEADELISNIGNILYNKRKDLNHQLRYETEATGSELEIIAEEARGLGFRVDNSKEQIKPSYLSPENELKAINFLQDKINYIIEKKGLEGLKWINKKTEKNY